MPVASNTTPLSITVSHRAVASRALWYLNGVSQGGLTPTNGPGVTITLTTGGTGGALPGIYDLSSSAAATTLIVGGQTTITTNFNNTGVSGTNTALSYSSLASGVASGGGSLGSTGTQSGTSIATGASGTPVTYTYTSGATARVGHDQPSASVTNPSTGTVSGTATRRPALPCSAMPARR